jgi:hypothetical protein
MKKSSAKILVFVIFCVEIIISWGIPLLLIVLLYPSINGSSIKTLLFLGSIVIAFIIYIIIRLVFRNIDMRLSAISKGNDESMQSPGPQ